MTNKVLINKVVIGAYQAKVFPKEKALATEETDDPLIK